MKRFLMNLLLHPGTWVAVGVILVGCCIAFPLVVPILAPIAMTSFAVSVPAFIEYIIKGIEPYIDGFNPGKHGSVKGDIKYFFTKHPFQAAVLLLTVALFITALVLTIGFFTGGASFAFMAPLLAVGAGSLFGPALVGFAAVMAPLTLGNNLKRFLGWLDSFTRDGAAANAEQTGIKTSDAEHAPLVANKWEQNRVAYTERLTKGNPIAYLKLWGEGVSATILPDEKGKGWFTSPDAELQQKPKVLA
jgi:hypothetical protein